MDDIADKQEGNTASVEYNGDDILVDIQVKDLVRGAKAVEILEKAEVENRASFGTVANNGYEIVIMKIEVTLPDNLTNYVGSCIPDIRVRDKNGELINNEAVYVYAGELRDYDNTGTVKTYDVIFEIGKNVKNYSVQFGTYEKENYIWYSK